MICCSTMSSGCTRRRRITSTSCSRCGSVGSRFWSSTNCWVRRWKIRRRARWLLDRRITPNSVGRVTAMAMRPWLDAMPAPALADHLIGGIALEDLPKSESSALLLEVLGGTSFLIPPIPNTLFQRDPSCWIYDGVSCNPMFWPARKPETLLQRAVYKFHPDLQGWKLQYLVRRFGRGLHRRQHRRRRRHARRQGNCPDRHGRAHHPSGGRPAGS